MKKEFKVGDRVSVCAGASSFFPNQRKLNGGGELRKFQGTILDIEKDNALVEYLHYEKGQGRIAGMVVKHLSELRHLKPKTKPERKEARRVWVYEPLLQSKPPHMGDLIHAKLKQSLLDPKKNGPTNEIEFREVLPGEVVVTKESLADAWNEEWKYTAWGAKEFDKFCKRLFLGDT